MKSLTIYVLFLAFASSAMALGWSDDDTTPPKGFIYSCSTLKPPLIIQPEGKVFFIFPNVKEAHAAEEASLDREFRPPGRGGAIFILNAWAAGTSIRIPASAFSGQSFSYSWANIVATSGGHFKGSGVCKRTDAPVYR